MRRVPILVAIVALVVTSLGCGRPCRKIAVTPVQLRCQSASTFSGELHFDDRATFESFLTAECLPDATDGEVAAVLDAVDFLADVVFVAVDDRAQVGRCLETRTPEVVEVCQDGLRVSFGDNITDALDCPGKWTVAFTLPRAEMRAATISANEAAPF